MERSIKQISRKAHLRLVGAAMVVVCALLIVGLSIMLFAPIRQGHKLLAAIAHLKVGSSDFSETGRVAHSMGFQTEDDTSCAAQNCSWKIVKDNGYYPGFWRGQETTLSIVLTVESNRLVQISVDFGRGQSARDPKVDVFEQVPALWRMRSTTEVNSGFDETTGKAVTAFVRLAPSASDADRERYLGFDLSCFSRYQGCSYVHEFLPSLPDHN
jgi:hypothetical protein